uniref:Uncharacterized protein n=1 Tax=Arundo donax TaxID=35708 RepID=A0A0A9CG36_ARUDO
MKNKNRTKQDTVGNHSSYGIKVTVLSRMSNCNSEVKKIYSISCNSDIMQGINTEFQSKRRLLL